MTIRIFSCSNSDTLMNDVNKYLSGFNNDEVVSIQMTESDRYNSVMVVTK